MQNPGTPPSPTNPAWDPSQVRVCEEFMLLPLQPDDQLTFHREHQVASAPSSNDRVIDVDQQTRSKAELNPDEPVIVYECKWDERGNPCGKWIEGNAKEIRTHLRIHHGVNGQTKDMSQCKWSSCTDELKYGSIPRHIMTHLKVTFYCSICEQTFARDDCIQSHRRTNERCADSEVITVSGEGARRILPYAMTNP